MEVDQRQNVKKLSKGVLDLKVRNIYFLFVFVLMIGIFGVVINSMCEKSIDDRIKYILFGIIDAKRN